jgi:hypothetical protein
MCDTGYIIRDHLPAIMQAISVDLAKRENKHDIPLQLTRCYCTAVMMTHLLVDQVEAALSYCNHTSTKARSTNDRNYSRSTAQNMSQDVLDINSPIKHSMYYVLLTSYTSPADSTQQKDRYYFPGHVFVIEKVPADTNNPSLAPFRLYQSYIGAYDLKKYMDMSRSDLHVTHEQMKKNLDGLEMMMGVEKKWDAEVSTFWNNLTLTNQFDEVQNMTIDGNIHLCYHKIDIDNCNGTMQSFLTRHITELKNLKKASKGKEVYGTHTSKNNEYEPLTVDDMLVELENTQLKKTKSQNQQKLRMH